jgi:sulfur carrier protein
MIIIVNGENREFEANATLQSVVENLGIADKVMAAALNTEIVKKDEWASCSLSEGDKLELLHFVGGG